MLVILHTRCGCSRIVETHGELPLSIDIPMIPMSIKAEIHWRRLMISNARKWKGEHSS